MPEFRFHVRRPDGESRRRCSPSPVVEDYFIAGAGAPPVSEGLRGRVREKYGFYRTKASGRITETGRTVADYSSGAGATVAVEALRNADGSAR